MITVRGARPGDEGAISSICSAGFAASSNGLVAEPEIVRRARAYYDVARVLRDLAPAPPGWLGYLVAEDEGDVVGAAGGSLDGEVGRVLVLYVDLERRGQGVGTALLDHLTREQEAARARVQRVWVTDGNEMGLPFYRARGFREAGREPFGPAPQPGRTVDSVILERQVPTTSR